MSQSTPPSNEVSRARASTVATLFRNQATLWPERTAIETRERKLSYGELLARSLAVARALEHAGVGRGDRVAILSENRAEYLEVVLAVAELGAVAACPNWRLAAVELADAVDLVEPSLVFVSPRHAERWQAAGRTGLARVEFGPAYEAWLAQGGTTHEASAHDVDPEQALLMLYTSGTTGRPKAALISHRAEIVRNLVTRAEFRIEPDDTFVAWSPLYHMGAADNSLGTLMTGGKVIVIDGFDAEELASIVEREPLGWLLLMPGMVGRFVNVLRMRRSEPKGVRVCGVMADLVPRHEIAEVTKLLRAPYANTFGATETGCPPCSSSLLPVGEVPKSLEKRQSPFCEVRLVDADDRDVEPGSPGELCMRGPTLFSGYYRADETNRHDFRGGWFHMGDVFVRHADGSLDFVDRVKYLIKSGGENIYPAEIERVLLRDARVADAVVVKRPDPRWGEVPVAFVARHDEGLDEAALVQLCRAELAGFKQPKAFCFLALNEFPRSASGKILRHELEKRLT